LVGFGGAAAKSEHHTRDRDDLKCWLCHGVIREKGKRRLVTIDAWQDAPNQPILT
jgi:hypothetical protein